MTTFKLANYDDTIKEEQVENKEQQVPDNTEKNIKKDEEDISTIDITINGSIAEIVAKSLYKIFPNTSSISQEHINDNIVIRVPSNDKTNIKIVTLTQEEIINSPLKSLRKANTKDSIVYISTETIYSKEENWFYLNISNEHYFTINSIINKVKYTCK